MKTINLIINICIIITLILTATGARATDNTYAVSKYMTVINHLADYCDNKTLIELGTTAYDALSDEHHSAIVRDCMKKTYEALVEHTVPGPTEE